MRKESITLEELTEEYNSLNEAMLKLKDEINMKRRNMSEMKSRLTELENRINAKRYEMLTDHISKKTGVSVDTFIDALEKGNVLVEHEKDVSEGRSEPKNGQDD